MKRVTNHRGGSYPGSVAELRVETAISSGQLGLLHSRDSLHREKENQSMTTIHVRHCYYKLRSQAIPTTLVFDRLYVVR